jgi:hypothetical protein
MIARRRLAAPDLGASSSATTSRLKGDAIGFDQARPEVTGSGRHRCLVPHGPEVRARALSERRHLVLGIARRGGVINVASRMVFRPMPVSKLERRRLT